MRKVALIVLVTTACAPASPDVPSYVNDVKPILDAHCSGCHRDPSVGGAPFTFRLDVANDTTRLGEQIFGAQSMAPFVAESAGHAGGPALSPRQKDILRAWADQPVRVIGTRGANTLPTAHLLPAATQLNADTGLTFTVVGTDADGDGISGELFYVEPRGGRRVILSTITRGGQDVTWDTSSLPPGPIQLTARLQDDFDVAHDVPIATVNVAHASGTTALGITADFARVTGGPDDPITRDDLVLDGDTIHVTGFVSNGSAVGSSALTFEAFRDTTVITLDTLPAVGPNSGFDRAFTVDLGNFTQTPEGWRLRVTATNGGSRAVVISQPIVLSATTTTDTYASFTTVMLQICLHCHNDQFPQLPNWDNAATRRKHGGRAWRKLVPLREMPPPSRTLVGARDLTGAERDRLATWFLAGAP